MKKFLFSIFLNEVPIQVMFLLDVGANGERSMKNKTFNAADSCNLFILLVVVVSVLKYRDAHNEVLLMLG